MSDGAAAESVRDDAASGWSTDEANRPLYRTYRFVVVGIASGLLGGMGAFMFSRAVLVPSFVAGLGRQTPGLVVTVLGGALAYLLAVDTRESARAMVLGLFVALATLVATRVAPAFMLPFPPVARDAIINDQLQYVAHTTINVLLLVYWGGYLTTVSLFGFLDY